MQRGIAMEVKSLTTAQAPEIRRLILEIFFR